MLIQYQHRLGIDTIDILIDPPTTNFSICALTSHIQMFSLEVAGLSAVGVLYASLRVRRLPAAQLDKDRGTSGGPEEDKGSVSPVSIRGISVDIVEE